MIHYFAYGSNMDLKRLEHMEIRFRSIIPGKLKGWKLVFNVIDNKYEGTGYANIVEDPESFVEGLIVETDRHSIRKLDWCEDYPDYYIKRRVEVVNFDGEKLRCMTYVGNQERIAEGLRPHKKYMKHLLNGKIFLDLNYYRHLARIRTID